MSDDNARGELRANCQHREQHQKLVLDQTLRCISGASEQHHQHDSQHRYRIPVTDALRAEKGEAA